MCGQVVTLPPEVIHNYENLHTFNQYSFIGTWNHYGETENTPKETCGVHRDPSLHPGKINHN